MSIRLIELFGGIGAQAAALRNIGADFSHYRYVDFDKYSVKSYNAIHGTNFDPIDIRELHGSDLDIGEKDKFTYLMTYSFPCQDLSVSGKQKGMTKGSGTRSGLLWEVERILKETKELPQILLMENVPMVHAKKNLPDFELWKDFLKNLGYSNFVADLNAKDFGIPQNRKRCFMVSLLENDNFEFPEKIPLKKTLMDIIESKVDEKYFIHGNDRTKNFIKKIIANISSQSKVTRNEQRAKSLGNIYGRDSSSGFSGTVFDKSGLSPTLTTMMGGNRQPMIVDNCRVRKLTPKECWRLMGFNDADFEKAQKVNSNTQLYKQAGNSIVVPVLEAIFRKLIP